MFEWDAPALDAPLGLHVVVQDWAGPIGLRQAVDQPDRFDRLFIFNTWLHHEGYE